MASCYARHVKYFSLVGLPGSKGEQFFIAAIRPLSLVCNIFMASLASESWIMLQIRLHAIIWSYGLAQAGKEDFSPFAVNKRNTGVIQTWRSPLILTICRSLMRIRGLCESFVCNVVYVYASQQMFTTASGGSQDLGHSFSQYGPLSWWITYIYSDLYREQDTGSFIWMSRGLKVVGEADTFLW